MPLLNIGKAVTELTPWEEIFSGLFYLPLAAVPLAIPPKRNRIS